MHFTAATVVTVHALLHKQDVRAATGWIGLAWLSPFLGCALYWLLGINRVSRRGAQLGRPNPQMVHKVTSLTQDIPSHLRLVANVGDRISERPLMPGNSLSLLRGATRAYPDMLSAIRCAQRSVLMASYIFRADAAGNHFISALADAHGRGVTVRVLVDGVGGGYVSSPTVKRLRASGVPAARFLHSWVPWRMPLIHLRNHRKLLIVDGETAFLEGLNIGQENLPTDSTTARVSDVHFRLSGPVVLQLRETFARDWEFSAGEILGDNVVGSMHAAGNAIARAVEQGPDIDFNRLELLLLSVISAACNRIRIVTPYFLPDQRISSALQLAAFRGVAVEIVIPQKSNRPVVDWATRSQLGELISAGCRVVAGGQPFQHAKLMTVDGNWALVGSSNWDARSFRLNFELDVEIYGAKQIAQIDAVISELLGQARPISMEELSERAIAFKLRDAAARLMLPYL